MGTKIVLIIIDIVFGTIGCLVAFWGMGKIGFEKVVLIALVLIFLKIPSNKKDE